MTEFEKIESRIKQWNKLSAIEKIELEIELFENGHTNLLPDNILEFNTKNKVTYGWLKSAREFLKNPPAQRFYQ